MLMPGALGSMMSETAMDEDLRLLVSSGLRMYPIDVW